MGFALLDLVPLFLGLILRYFFENISKKIARYLSPGKFTSPFRQSWVKNMNNVTQNVILVVYLAILVLCLATFTKYINIGIVTQNEIISCVLYTPVAAIFCYVITWPLKTLMSGNEFCLDVRVC